MNEINLESKYRSSANKISKPVVSILIPFYNCVEITKACLKSLLDNTSGVSYEIILVDDASDEILDLLWNKSSPSIRVIRNQTRKNYSSNNNQAAAMAQGKYLCLLNNDTLVTPDWLNTMVLVLERSPDIAVLGNKHLFPGTEKLHHCGMAFDDNGLPWHLHPHTDPSLPAVNYQRDFQIVTFACVLIPNRVYRELNGLDEAFQNGFEDCDFCLRARKAGYRISYTPTSTIYHYGQASPDRQARDERNKVLFLSKWKGKIESDLDRITREDNAYNQKEKKRPRLCPPLEKGLHLAVDLGEANAFTWACVDLALALDQLGEPVSLSPGPIHQSIEPHQKKILKRLMRYDACRRFQVKWSHYWSTHLMQPLNGEINAEIFCTNYRYRPLGRFLDIWMRHVQVNGYRKLPVTSFNQEALLEIGVPREECSIVPLGYSSDIDILFPEGLKSSCTSNSDLNIFVVTNSHDLYRYGTDLLIQALGEVFSREDPVVVHIKDYGYSPDNKLLEDWIQAQKKFPRVTWHRKFLTKADLIRLYAEMDILVAPFRGEGFGLKILDAMALGLPVLMPTFGGPVDFCTQDGFLPILFEEVEVGECLDQRLYYIGQGAYWCQPIIEDLINQFRSLCDNRDKLQAIGHKARSFVHPKFSWKNTAKSLIKAFQTWEKERTERIGTRRGPDTIPLSVIIPTRDRENILSQALQAYQKQSLPPEQFEVVLVNDHGSKEKLESLLQDHPTPFSVRLLENRGKEGPAAARNLAIEQVRGEIILITGDDIIPGPHFLREHLEGHKRFPQLETALVGMTHWHPDLQITPFMEIISGEKGEQFDYEGAKHNREVSFGHFYTSNVSLKRAFLIEEEDLFSTHYRYAAYEDIELAYRLHLRGMVLRFIKSAEGFHYHAMSLRSFVERQRKVGRMLTLLAIQRPSYVPVEHAVFLKALEYARSSPQLSKGPGNLINWADDLIESLTSSYESSLEFDEQSKILQGRDIVDGDAAQWRGWLNQGSRIIWKTLNELILRCGMAEEWAANERDAVWAKNWVLSLTLPQFLGPNKLYQKMPFTRPGLDIIFADSRIISWTAAGIRQIPYSRTLFRKVKNSRLGQNLKTKLIKITRR